MVMEATGVIYSENNNLLVIDMAFTAIIEKEDDWYVAKAAEFEIASQGKSVEEAIANLKEAIELYLKHAEPDELAAIQKRQASLLIAPFDIERPRPSSSRAKPVSRSAASA